MPIATRITNTGNFLVNGEFDEFTGAPVINGNTMIWLDAAQTNSYPGTGNSWTSLTSQANVATLVNDPTFTSNNGGMITFDGVDDYAQITPPANVGNCTVATIEVWANIKQFGARMIFGFTGYDIYLLSNAMGFNTGNADQYGISAANVSNLGLIGNMKHYCFVMYNNTNSTTNPYTQNKIYVNGVSQPLSLLSVNPQAASTRTLAGNLTISGWTTNVAQYKVNMDLPVMKVYDRELNEAEILQNYNTLVGRFSLPANTSGTAIQRTTSNTVFATQFDEVTYAGNTSFKSRTDSTGTIFISGIFDEVTGAS